MRTFIGKNFITHPFSLLSGFVLLLAAFGLSFDAQQTKNNADAVWQNVTISLETPLSVKDAQTLCAKESELAFAVWGEQANTIITDPDLGRRTQADVLTVCGSPTLILPIAGCLSADDTEGCLIGEQTAWELFGSTQVTGDQIRIGDEVRTVRSVLHVPQNLIVICGALDSSSAYNRITLSSTQPADGEAFLMQSGMAGTLLRLDYLRSPRWLTELIPGKWSDFSGWRTNWDQKRKDFAQLSRVSKNSMELYYEAQCRILLWDTLLELVCVVASVGCVFRRPAS